MPAALSTDDPPARTWWNNLAKAPSSKDLRQAYVQEKSTRPPKPGKLNSFASAIGFKSKKQSPTLAIQDPPTTLINHVSSPISPPHVPVTRPPSKSVSSSRTHVDSIEPATPVDSQRDHRHSLLTLSDTDPFAGRPMIAVPIPHLPSDPNRLSAYSNPSVTELVSKKHEPPTPNRISYASSSSHSYGHGFEIPVTEPLRVFKNSENRQLVTKRSIGSLQYKRSEQLHRQASSSAAPSPTSPVAHSKAGSSSPLLDPHRLSQHTPAGPPRPKLRMRGMTDIGPSKTAGFFVQEQSPIRKISRKPSSSDIPSSAEAHSSTTRIVIRQASVSRIQPPTAPPTQRLPPPPPPLTLTALPAKSSQNDRSALPQRMGMTYRASASSSSSVSYASSESLPGSPYGVVERSSQRSGLSHGEPESPISFVHPPSRTLKKALSHQSLSRRGLTSPISAPPPMTPPENSAEKRKQRSFHHPRLPIPAIPLPNIRSRPASANSAAFPGSTTTSDSCADKRRGSGSATSISSRRRLFSTSSRPSTSHNPPTGHEDDSLSVFSLRSDTDSHLTPYKSWVHRDRKPNSFWDEGSPDQSPASPPGQTTDYTGPQAIMSRAEIAMLDAMDATIESWTSDHHQPTRPREMSILSASTTSDMSRDFEIIPASLAARPPPQRSSSKQALMYMSTTPTSPFQQDSRPPSAVSLHGNWQEQGQVEELHSSTQQVSRMEAQQRQNEEHQHHFEEHDQQHVYLSNASAAQSSSRNSPELISLPPPPRRRRGKMVSEPDVPQDAIAPSTPGPVTKSLTPTSSLRSARTSMKSNPTVSRPPSTLKTVSGSVRSKYSIEKSLHRRSVMRKPSFLEIDDDDDDDHYDEHADMSRDPLAGGDSFLDLARESFDTVRTEL